MSTTLAPPPQLEGLEDGPAVRMRADELAPFGWAPAMVLAAINVVDRMDANIVAGVLPLLQDEWGFSDTLGGAIPTAALVAGIFVSLPAGYWADRYPRTRLLAIVLATWSVLTFASALAVGFWMFFAIRVVLGAADHVDNPAASSLMADYYPPKARGRAFGIQRMAYYAGGSLGVLVGGILGELFGWRAAFLCMVLPGLAVAGLCWIMREPIRGAIDRFVANQEGQAVSQEEAAGAAATWVAEADDAELDLLGTGWRSLVSQLRGLMQVRTIFLVYVGLAVVFLGLAGIAYWLPSFFERSHDLGEGAAGGLAALIGLVGTIGGAYLGGHIGDRWHRSRPGGRILLSGLGLLGGSAAMTIAFTIDVLLVRVVLLAVAFLLMSLGVPNLTAAVADVLPAHQRGIGFALLTFLTSAGAAFGPLGVGVASDVTGSLTSAFFVLAIPTFAGSAVVLAARATFDADAERVLAQARQGATR